MIPKQYRQNLYVLKHASDAQQDSNGNWQDTTPSWSLHALCREETNGRGSRIQTSDGIERTFSSLVQLPVGTRRVPEGTQVIVADRTLTDTELASADTIRGLILTGEIRIMGECLKYDTGALHCRLWI